MIGSRGPVPLQSGWWLQAASLLFWLLVAADVVASPAEARVVSSLRASRSEQEDLANARAVGASVSLSAHGDTPRAIIEDNLESAKQRLESAKQRRDNMKVLCEAHYSEPGSDDRKQCEMMLKKSEDEVDQAEKHVQTYEDILKEID
eukprot:TRINITY_DN18376_c0_g1_i1.p1 TRINITY_DN18376_c0_g1~~TRINITY_DN18376_c0_g1_i1.p1  ORF type:complete len:147 (+),score=35.57 TRINITY_DN18376_c0_g1_i1:89-529(+)